MEKVEIFNLEKGGVTLTLNFIKIEQNFKNQRPICLKNISAKILKSLANTMNLYECRYRDAPRNIGKTSPATYKKIVCNDHMTCVPGMPGWSDLGSSISVTSHIDRTEDKHCKWDWVGVETAFNKM